MNKASSQSVDLWRLPMVVLLAGAIVLSLNMGVRQTFGLFIAPMTIDIGFGRGSFALAIAVQNLLWGVLTPACGMIADRYGTGRMLVAGGLLYVLGILVMALGQSVFTVHLGAGILVGMAVASCGFPLVLSVVARIAPEEKRSLWLAIAASGGSVGQFLLLPFGQLMITGFGWVIALLAMAALAALIVPLAAALSSPPATPATGPSQSLGDALKEAGRHPGFLLLNGGFFVCGFHVAFVGTHLPGYIVTCNLSEQLGANALGLIGFFNIIGGLLAGVLGSRFRKKYLLATIYLLRAVVIGIFLVSPKTELMVWLFSASFGLLWLSTVPLTSALVGQIFGPRYMATLFGIVMLSHQLGAFFGAWLGGINYDLTGTYDMGWVISVILGLLAAILHWPIADRPLEREAAASTS